MKVIEEKMAKRGDNVTVTFADNGYMLEASGRDDKDDWTDIKVVLSNLDQLNQALESISRLPKE
jgi:hypothetical protein